MANIFTIAENEVAILAPVIKNAITQQIKDNPSLGIDSVKASATSIINEYISVATSKFSTPIQELAKIEIDNAISAVIDELYKELNVASSPNV